MILFYSHSHPSRAFFNDSTFFSQWMMCCYVCSKHYPYCSTCWLGYYKLFRITSLRTDDSSGRVYIWLLSDGVNYTVRVSFCNRVTWFNSNIFSFNIYLNTYQLYFEVIIIIDITLLAFCCLMCDTVCSKYQYFIDLEMNRGGHVANTLVEMYINWLFIEITDSTSEETLP